MFNKLAFCFYVLFAAPLSALMYYLIGEHKVFSLVKADIKAGWGRLNEEEKKNKRRKDSSKQKQKKR